MSLRKEHDLIGEREVDADSYSGIQTIRGRENFNYTGRKMSRYKYFMIGYGMFKKAFAKANADCGVLDKKKAEFIIKVAEEVMEGKLHEHFILDPIQGGAGTSAHMNVNEVITNRALELMGEKKGSYDIIHPNDDTNHGQSTNDSYPSSAKLGAILYLKDVKAELELLITSFEKKAKEFSKVLKMGRTHLQDAVPMSVGQEYQAFADLLKDELPFVDHAMDTLKVLNMGATAIGTGITAPKGYAEKAIKYLSEIFGEKLENHHNMLTATFDTSEFLYASSILKKLGLKLIKICNDLRLSASGPTVGLKEIDIPELQPGSSIMPGKVNPVIPESVGQTMFQIIGNDLAISFGCENAQYQLNVFEPVMIYNLYESLIMMTSALNNLRVRCIDGIGVRADRCNNGVKNSVGIVTVLNPILGHDKTDIVAKEAYKTGKSVYDVVLEKKFLDKDKLEELLKVENMI